MLSNYPTLRFILQRSVWYFLTLMVAITINFFLPRFGADPIDLIMSKQKGTTGKQADDKRVAYMKEFGLAEQQKVVATVSGEILMDGAGSPVSSEILRDAGLLTMDTLASLWHATFAVSDAQLLKSSLLGIINKKKIDGVDLASINAGEIILDEDAFKNSLRAVLTAEDIFSLGGLDISYGSTVYSADIVELSQVLNGATLINNAYLVKEADDNLVLYDFVGENNKPRYHKVSRGTESAANTLQYIISDEVVYQTAGESDKDFVTRLEPIRRSLFGQYFQYLGMMSRGDLGTSFVKYPKKVSAIVAEAVPWTIALQFPSIVLGWLIGNFLGALAAYRRGVFDKVLFPCALLVNSIPSFAIAMLLVYVFAEKIPLFPASGGYAIGVVPSFTWAFISSTIYHYILPFLSVFPVFASGQATGMRTMGVYELGTGYVKYAKTLGIRENKILMYIFRNAMLPQLTGLALNLGTMIGGALITEMIFSYPGLGMALLSAAQNNDYPLIQGGSLLVMITVLVANFTVDILIGFFDPRVKAGRTGV